MSKIQRNSPCPCGSGIKFKKCCIEEYNSTADTHDHHCGDPDCDEHEHEQVSTFGEEQHIKLLIKD